MEYYITLNMTTFIETSSTLEITTPTGITTQENTSGVWNITDAREENGIQVEYMERKIAAALWLYVSPIIIIVGILGNFMSVIVMSLKQLRGSVTSLFLMVLSITDTLVLLSGLLRQWILSLADLDVRTLSLAGCRFHIFTVYWSTQFAAWVLTAVTIERFISVVFPHQAKSIVTKRSAVLVLIIVAVVLFCINAHTFETSSLLYIPWHNQTYVLCFHDIDRFDHFIRNQWPWIDFTVFCIIPFVLIFFGNLGISVRLLRSHFMKTLTTAKSVKMTNMTVILMAVSVYFLIAILPIQIFLTIQGIWVGKPLHPHYAAQIQLYWAISNMLLYSNNAINFFLYILTSPRFRKLLIGLFVKDGVPVHTQMTQTLEMSARVTQVGPTTRDSSM